MTSNHKFFYFKDEKYPIEVTDETLDITPYTFSRDGILSEQNSLYQFFNDIDKTKQYNIVDIGAQSGLYSLFQNIYHYLNFMHSNHSLLHLKFLMRIYY